MKAGGLLVVVARWSVAQTLFPADDDICKWEFGVVFNFGEALPFHHNCITVYLQKQGDTQVTCLLCLYIAIAMATGSSDH